MDPCFVSLPTKGAWKRWKPLIYDTKPAIKIVLYSKTLEQHKTMRELSPHLTSWCITAGRRNVTVMICFSWCCMQIFMMKQSRPGLDTRGLCAEHAKQWRELMKYYKQTLTSEERDLTRQTCCVYSIPCHALWPSWPQNIREYGGGRSVHGEDFCWTKAMKRAAELKDFCRLSIHIINIITIIPNKGEI